MGDVSSLPFGAPVPFPAGLIPPVLPALVDAGALPPLVAPCVAEEAACAAVVVVWQAVGLGGDGPAAN